MRRNLIRKIRIGLMVLLVVVQFAGLVSSLYGFRFVEDRINKLDNHLYNNWRQAVESEIVRGYTVKEFLKDFYINSGLRGDAVTLSLIAMSAILLTWIIFGLLIKRGNKTTELK